MSDRPRDSFWRYIARLTGDAFFQGLGWGFGLWVALAVYRSFNP